MYGCGIAHLINVHYNLVNTRPIIKKGDGRMKCKKCDGLMVLQSFFDHFLNFEGWKCLNCGKIIVKKDKSIEYDSFSIFYQQNKCKNRN